MEYIHDLISNDSFYNLIPTYLFSISTKSKNEIEQKEWLSQIILRQTIDSEYKGLKLIQLCRKYKLMTTIPLLYKILTLNSLKQKRFGTALNYLKLTQNPEFQNQIVNRIVVDYLQQGNTKDIQNLIEQFDIQQPINETIAFILKYKELYLLKKNGKHEEFIELTMKLLHSQIVPMSFWLLFIRDIVSILPVITKPLSSQDTFRLLQLLKEVQLSHKREEYLASTTTQEIQNIQLMLTHNLAQSIMFTENVMYKT